MARKGEIVSEEVKAKRKATEVKNLQELYDWEKAEKFLDSTIDNGSRNRKTQFITIRDFKKNLFDGLNTKDMRKNGISKHLIQFYSNFLQNKIKITEDEFVKEYEEIGMPLEDIAKKYGITKENISFLRQLYGIKAKGANYQKRKRTEEPLTRRQIEILCGSLMGDAGKMSSSSAKFKHTESQKDYVLWLYKEFENIASKNSLKYEENVDYRSETVNKFYRFYTMANSDVEKILSMFYIKRNGEPVKIVTKEILDLLTPISVATWYMDDGKIDHHHRSSADNSAEIILCTDSFTLEEHNLIVDWFKEKWGIETEIKEQLKDNGSIKRRIRIRYTDNDKFLSLVSPYVLPVFHYKIHYKDYLDYRGNKESDISMKEIGKCPLGTDFNRLPMNTQDEYVSKFINYYYKKGLISLIGYPDDYVKHINQVIKYDASRLIVPDCIKFYNLGNKFLMSHFDGFWGAKSKGNLSPKEIFDNPSFLSEIIRKIIFTGKFPNGARVLKEVLKYRGNKSASGFMPCVAKAIYTKYCTKNTKVLDFCAGYGGRLFGAMACDKVGSYTGIEINYDSYASLHKLYGNLRLFANVTKPCTLINQDSILGMEQFADKTFDFCFTSVPYFDVEQYSDKKEQSSSLYPTYGNWFENFFVKAVEQALRVSKVVAINIANSGGYFMADDFERWIEKKGINLVEKTKLILPYYGEQKSEPIFVINSSL